MTPHLPLWTTLLGLAVNAVAFAVVVQMFREELRRENVSALVIGGIVLAIVVGGIILIGLKWWPHV
jgi:uncharacterized membrane protein YvlD (DUF360 family)